MFLRVNLANRINSHRIDDQTKKKGQTIFEYDTNSETGGAVKQIWGKINKTLGVNNFRHHQIVESLSG